MAVKKKTPAKAPKKAPKKAPTQATRKKVEAKAHAWNQRESLTTKARVIELPDELEAIEIGEIVAIEYRSKKYDGKARVWRHEVAKKRTLHISLDGKILVILPGFKITKRGIEG